jgi:hypothetical protein
MCHLCSGAASPAPSKVRNLHCPLPQSNDEIGRQEVIEILSSDEDEPRRRPDIISRESSDDEIIELVPKPTPSSTVVPPPSAALGINLPPFSGAFTPPPWYQYRTPDSNFDFLLNTRSSTSSSTHRHRKPLRTVKGFARHDNLSFDITSWKKETREEFGPAT